MGDITKKQKVPKSMPLIGLLYILKIGNKTIIKVNIVLIFSPVASNYNLLLFP